MAIQAGQVTVGTSAVLIYQADGDGASVHVHNDEAAGSAAVWLGGPTVTITTGLKLEAATDEVVIDLHGNDALYAITSTGTDTVSYLVADY